MTKLIISILIINLFSVSLCSEIGVPVLLWQQKTDSDIFDRKSTVYQINDKILAEDYLRGNPTIVAFVQNLISLEQFTTEDEEQLNALKPIFKDNSIKTTLLTDVLNPTKAFTSKHFQHQNWDQIHVKNGDKVVIELPQNRLIENNELLNQLITEIRKNISKNALFLITGDKNWFHSIDLDKHKHQYKRAVQEAPDQLEVEEEDKMVNSYSDIDNLIDIDNCLYLYTDLITLNRISNGQLTPITKFNTTFIGKHSTGICLKKENNTSAYIPGKLVFTLNDDNETDITVNLVIENKGSNYFWSVTNSSIIIESKTKKEFEKSIDFHFIPNQLQSEQLFGYSCNKFTLKSQPRNYSNNELLQISLDFRRFQFQPFKNPNKNLKFSESYDCEVWMTLPLWMGLITLIVMFIILSSGIYFIAIVNTPDRFENPKGKPLLINTVEE